MCVCVCDVRADADKNSMSELTSRQYFVVSLLALHIPSCVRQKLKFLL